jgi:hypothetical protein
MTPRVCRGYIPDPPGHLRTSFRRVKAVSILDAVDFRPSAPAVLDQGETGSCTGESTGPAITTALVHAGTPLGFVASPAGIYKDARCIDRADPSVALTDNGAMPNQVMRALSEWGVRPMRSPTSDGRYSDCEPATVNAEPTFEDLEVESLDLILGPYGIDSTGSQRVTDICSAMTLGFAVTGSVSAGNDTFQHWTPDKGPLGAQSPVELDHYIWFIAYRTASGKRIFRIRNSWSAEWGDAGDIEVTEDFVAQMGDLYALNVRLMPKAAA